MHLVNKYKIETYIHKPHVLSDPTGHLHELNPVSKFHESLSPAP